MGEEHHGVVGVGRIDEFYEVLVSGRSTLYTDAATCLCAEFSECGALDVAEVADGNHHFFLGIELLGIKVFTGGHVNLSLTLVTPFLLHFEKFVLHHLATKCIVGEYLL